MCYMWLVFKKDKDSVLVWNLPAKESLKNSLSRLDGAGA